MILIILKFTDNLLVLHTFGYIKIKEITIQNGLHDASNDYNPIDKIFRIIAVNPVQYV